MLFFDHVDRELAAVAVFLEQVAYLAVARKPQRGTGQDSRVSWLFPTFELDLSHSNSLGV